MRQPSRDELDAWLRLYQDSAVNIVQRHSPQHAEDAVQRGMLAVFMQLERLSIDADGQMWLRAADGTSQSTMLRPGYLVAASQKQLLNILRHEKGKRSKREEVERDQKGEQSASAHSGSIRGLDWLTSPIGSLLRTETLGVIQECVDRLDHHDRWVLEQSYGLGRTRDSIASECGRSEGQVGNDLRRAKRQLEECMLKRLTKPGSES
jgi:RNA polymerase sigma factor (sigma-70 family)